MIVASAHRQNWLPQLQSSLSVTRSNHHLSSRHSFSSRTCLSGWQGSPTRPTSICAPFLHRLTLVPQWWCLPSWSYFDSFGDVREVCWSAHLSPRFWGTPAIWHPHHCVSSSFVCLVLLLGVRWETFCWFNQWLGTCISLGLAAGHHPLAFEAWLLSTLFFSMRGSN